MTTNTTSSTNNPELTPETIEEIKKALYHAESIVADTPKKVHMTRDFYNRLLAMFDEMGLVRPMPKNDGEGNFKLFEHVAGILIEVHDEPCEKEYWFDYHDDIKNAAAFGWIFRNNQFIKAEVKPIQFPVS